MAFIFYKSSYFKSMQVHPNTVLFSHFNYKTEVLHLFFGNMTTIFMH